MDVSEIIGRKDKIMKEYIALVRMDDREVWKKFKADSFTEAEGKVIQFLDTAERRESDLITIERLDEKDIGVWRGHKVKIIDTWVDADNGKNGVTITPAGNYGFPIDVYLDQLEG